MSLKQNPDQTDEHLISLLTANARVSAALLARKVGLSRSAVQQRLRRLEQQGIIEGYSVVLKTIPVHPQRWRAMVMVVLESRQQERVIESLRGMAEVLVAHTVSGEYDLMVEIAATDAEDLDQLLSKIGRLPGVGRTTSFILLSRKISRGDRQSKESNV